MEKRAPKYCIGIAWRICSILKARTTREFAIVYIAYSIMIVRQWIEMYTIHI